MESARRGSNTPLQSGGESSQDDARVKRQQASVYDAVAGRISASGFIPKVPIQASTRDTAATSSNPVSAESVLFRRKYAPERFEENDPYFASDGLGPNLLPDSDLLKAIHCYTSDFYSRATQDGGRGDYRSMDDTALLAFGVLLEEYCREVLGSTGDLVFTEGAESLLEESRKLQGTESKDGVRRERKRNRPNKDLRASLPD